MRHSTPLSQSVNQFLLQDTSIRVVDQGRYAFRHPLIRRALDEEIAPELRERVHAVIAEAYEAASTDAHGRERERYQRALA